MSEKKESVVCVDLDGTLVQSDTLAESLAVLLHQSPWVLLLIPFWLLAGRACLKYQLARRFKLNAALLPYNDSVIRYIKNRKESGAKIVLVTAASQLVAEVVAEQVGLIDEVVASDGRCNLKGQEKAECLVERYGEGGFDYIGNSRSDLPVWRCAKGKILVDAPAGCKGWLRSRGYEFEVLQERCSKFKKLLIFLRAIRVQQWVKNTLVFVPVLMAHQWLNHEKMSALLLVFIAFSFAASSVYLVNDLVDLDNDRVHRYKKFRPFAAGRLSLFVAIFGSPLFLVAAILLALSVSQLFLAILLLYYLISSFYSFWLKKLALVDIIVLAILYTIRVMAGGYGAEVDMSPWLLAFALFWFLSLACVKRFSELLAVADGKQSQVSGRGYLAKDLATIGVFGVVSGYISILVVALYLQSIEVLKLYQRPAWLWLACPVLLYWVSRVWLLAQRGEIKEDPILFAVTDRVSYFVLGIGLLIMLAAL